MLGSLWTRHILRLYCFSNLDLVPNNVGGGGFSKTWHTTIKVFSAAWTSYIATEEVSVDSDDDGLFLACDDFWGKVWRFIPGQRVPLLLLLLSGDKPAQNQFHPLARISPQWLSEDDCGRVFPDELRASSFPDRFQHYTKTAQLAYSNFVESRVYACLGVTCHRHFWQNDRGLYVPLR